MFMLIVNQLMNFQFHQKVKCSLLHYSVNLLIENLVFEWQMAVDNR